MSHLLLWSSPLKFLESCVVFRGQNSSRQRLSSSRHLTLLNQRLCHTATPLFVTLVGTSADRCQLVLRCFVDQLRPPALCECVDPPCELVASLLLVQEHHWQQNEQFPSSRFSNNVALVFLSRSANPNPSRKRPLKKRGQLFSIGILFQKIFVILTSSNCSHDPGGTSVRTMGTALALVSCLDATNLGTV